MGIITGGGVKKMKKKEKIVGAAVLLTIGFIALIIGITALRGKEKAYTEVFTADAGEERAMYDNELSSSQFKDTTKLEEKDENTGTIVVDIKGAVKNPREYELTEGSRVRDLIEMAGGLTDEADVERIHYATILEDEECVRIYKIGEELEEEDEIDSSEGKSSNGVGSGKVNINKASSTELQELPGIGEVKAQSIIDYREANGKFSSVDELSNVNGIGSKTVEKLRDMVEIK